MTNAVADYAASLRVTRIENDDHRMTSPAYTVVIATFRRPESLSTVLEGLLCQSTPPALVVVADNDPAGSARDVIARLPATAVRVELLGLGENLGPAGGWGRAAARARECPGRGEWLMVLDDDDPVTSPSVCEQLLQAALGSAPSVAAVGLRGARWCRRSARLVRVAPDRGERVDCGYLASSGLPLYRWSAIDRCGFFDEELFFGFEDLDLGLRLKRQGYAVQVVSIDEPHHVSDTSPIRVAWREYFKTRALARISRRHLGWWAVAVLGVRSVLVGSAVLAIRQGDSSLAAARWRGYHDGLRGRLGRNSYVPDENPAKHA